MDIVKPLNGSIKRYWRRKKYKRLHAEVAHQKRVQVMRFGRGSSRRFWKIRIVPKLQWRIPSPLKLLTRLRNAYVKMMFSLAGNVGSLNTNSVFGAKRIPKARQAPVVYSADEIENRLVYEIYLALKASRDLAVAPMS
ncbi:uncharacterized protein LOC116207084 [Punica granatum]|uniref:Uncharacterized protein n=2 Tax=Punica granatum TaxID=22663 RepID=A0A218VX07_PUNGR|nr:uncharacterized protein LOC116207084 [Punica granatum]OWM64412.1 hypothetical protein CDL15_Pgr020379 [Punica granatum]PKI56766.1 hypothetical protein CRG98_022827 [Punica granatum]